MSRLVTEPFDVGNAGDWTKNAGTWSLTAVPRSGNYSMRLSNNCEIWRTFTAMTEGFAQAGLRIDSIGAEGTYIALGNLATSSVYVKLLMYIDRWMLQVNGATVATYYMAVQLATWYVAELHVDRTGGTVTAKVDGREIISWTGTLTGVTNFDTIRFRGEGSHGEHSYIDDVIVNDASGATNNSWPNQRKLLVYPLGSTVASTGWAGSDGDSADNHLMVDEVFTDNDTTYITSSSSGDEITLGTPGFAAPAGYEIKQLLVGETSKDHAAAGGTLEVEVISNATTSATLSRALLGSYTPALHLFETDPDTSGAWSEAAINAVGVVLRNGS